MFVVYHWECVPTEYIMAFETLDEAIEFKNENDLEDEWLIGEIER